MKWPAELLLIRHAESAFNDLKLRKQADPEYQEFLRLFAGDRSTPEIKSLAQTLYDRYSLGCSDRNMPITLHGEEQARLTGRALRDSGLQPPDVIFVSPFARTIKTLRLLQEECPALRGVKEYEEERIRERDHGLGILYNDWRIYHVFHPDQALLQQLVGIYDYRFLNGENIPDVRQRNLSWITTLTREFSGKRVMAITHHLTILATRANLERLGPEGFMHLDEHEAPVNCGVTRYIGRPELGHDGRLEMNEYNRQHYPSRLTPIPVA